MAISIAFYWFSIRIKYTTLGRIFCLTSGINVFVSFTEPMIKRKGPCEEPSVTPPLE